MDRVLLDGTTLMSATRLLNGQDTPSALNVFALSLLVEGLILHGELIVMDTLRNDDRLSNAARGYGDVVKVEQHNVDEIVDRYIGMEFPELDLRDPQLQHYGGSASPVSNAEKHLHGVLESRSYSDDADMSDYLSLLDQAHKSQLAIVKADRKARKEAQKSRFQRYVERHFQTVALLYSLGELGEAFSSLSGGPEPFRDGTQLGSVAADNQTRDAWESFLERYTIAGSSSTWQAGKLSRVTARTPFTPSLLIRTHFYLLASEVLGVPYRPDALRAPICWKFFHRGSFADFALEERFVDAAESLARDRVASVNDFIGRPAFAALPLFVARVLNDSNSPADVVPQALEIRNSTEARRFREHLSTLYHAEKDGDIDVLVKEITRYSELLRRKFGGAGASVDVVWSLAAATGEAAVKPSPAAAIDLGLSAARSAVAASGAVRRWWYGRKVALIARTVKEAQKARSLQPQLRRLFGADLHQDDLVFLDRVAEIGTPGHGRETSKP